MNYFAQAHTLKAGYTIVEVTEMTEVVFLSLSI